MKKIFALISILMFLSTTFTNAQYAWNQKANFGGGLREGSSCFSIGNKGYISCGYDWSSTYMDLWEYDQATDSWTQKTSMPLALRRYGVGFSIGTKGYVGSGQTNGSFLVDFWEYDQATDSWTQKADIPGDPTYGAIGFSIGSKGYFGTGNTGTAQGPYRNDFYEFDPASNVWVQKANFPGGERYGAYGIGTTTKGYLGFGLDESGNPILYKDWWEYDPLTDNWTAMANFPGNPRTYLGGFVINGEPYVGTGADWVPYNDFYKYDPIADSWSAIDSFPGNGRYLSSSFSIGNIGYLGIGYDFNGDLDDFYEYAPVTVAPNVNFKSSDTTWCGNTFIDFYDLSTNGPTSWQWYFPGGVPATSSLQNPKGISYSGSGSFNVKLVVSNTIGSDSIELINFLTELQSPAIPVISQSNDTLISSPAYSYAWYEINNPTIVVSTNSYFIPNQPGSYIVVVQNIAGCDATSNVWVILSTQDLTNSSSFSILPNPSNGVFTLNISGIILEKIHYTIYDALGHIVENADVENANSKVEFNITEKGLYFLEIKNDKKITRKKIIVN